MVRRTLAQARTHLARLASVSGLDAASPRFVELLNLATEELMMESDFPQTMARVRFAVTEGEFTLPNTLERAAGIVVDEVPVSMRSPWMEYVEFGTGLLSEDDTNFLALDRDSIPTHTKVPNDGANYKVRVRSAVDEDVDGSPPIIVVRGYDENGKWVRSTNSGGERIDGVELDIQTTNNDSTPFFSSITEVVKPVTKDFVYLYALNGSAETELGRYHDYETVPFYKRYFIPSLKERDGKTYTIQVRAKVAYRPVSDDSDILLISNVNALRSMIMALHSLETGQFDEYSAHKSISLNLMAKEAQHFRGRVKTPAISVAKGEGNYIEDIR